MEEHPFERRNTIRIGVMFIASAAMVLSAAVLMPMDGYRSFALILLALMGVVGIGLLFRALFARVIAGLLFLVLAVVSPIVLIGDLASIWNGWEPGWALANAVGTTLLLVWSCFRAILVLMGVPRRESAATARLTGGVLAVIAASHLWIAAEVGLGWHGGLSYRVSPSGTQLLGFQGWQIWHLLLLVTSLLMLAGPRRTLEHAATGLIVLSAGLVPLLTITTVRDNLLMLEGFTVFAGMTLFPVYLSWWLRAGLREPSQAELSAE